MVWYSHLFKSFPQFVVNHTVKGFGVVSKAEVDAFLELSSFFNYPTVVGSLISASLPFLNPNFSKLENLQVLGSCTVEAWLGES